MAESRLRERYTKDFIAEAKSRTSLVALIGRDVLLKPRGREHVGLCPFHDERTPSFTVVEDKGFFHCFGCGANGDAIRFLMALHHLEFLEALEQLAEDAGMIAHGDRPKPERPAPVVPRLTAAEIALEHEQEIAELRAIWGAARPIGIGAAPDLYLEARGIKRRPLPPTLRWIPHCRWHDPRNYKISCSDYPAMVAAVQDPDGAITGLHLTWVRPDGTDKAPLDPEKKMRGVVWRGAVRLGKATDSLAIGEGIETCLSIREAKPELAVWAALSLGNIAGGGVGKGPIRPEDHGRPRPRSAESAEPDMHSPGIRLPASVKRVLIVGDADNKDRLNANQLLRRAAARFQREGRQVRLALPAYGHDFNSLLLE